MQTHPTRSRKLLRMSADDAAQHGLAPVAISIDAQGAGMAVRTFPGDHTYLLLNGPPGAPISILICDCTGLPFDIETAIRTRVTPWTTPAELGAHDHGSIFGTDQEGMTFATESGPHRAVWFAVLLRRNAGTVLLAMSVSGSEGRPAEASEILANSMIAKAISTLVIE